MLACGSSDCKLDPAAPSVTGMQCATECRADGQHTGTATPDTAVCVLRECAERTYNSTAAYPCGGSQCLYNPVSTDSRVCWPTCTDAEQYKASYEIGTCVARTCTELTDCDACAVRGEECHWKAGHRGCEEMSSYVKWRTMVIVLASVGGGFGLMVIAVVWVGRICYKKHE
jgi:hypothetical protein